MRNLITLIFLSFCIAGFGQNETLDKKAGFKNFTIGDSQSKYSAFLTHPTKQEDGSTWYSYTTSDTTIYSVFGKRFDLLVLGFDQNQKLNNIQIIKEYSKDNYGESLDDYKEVLANLKNMFGKPSMNLSDEKKSDISYGWDGLKIFMMFENEYLGYSKGSRNSVTIMTNPVKNNSTDF